MVEDELQGGGGAADIDRPAETFAQRSGVPRSELGHGGVGGHVDRPMDQVDRTVGAQSDGTGRARHRCRHLHR